MTQIILVVIAFSLLLGFCPVQAQLPRNDEFRRLFKTTLATKHFIVYSKDDDKYARWYAFFLEDFILYVDRNLTSLPNTWPVEVFLFADEEQFNEFARKNLDKSGRLLGTFVKDRNAFFTSNTCGLGTTAHEIMHKIVGEKFKVTEEWAEEGIPAFYEKVYGYQDRSGPIVYVGYQNPLRLESLGEKLPNLTIQHILSDAIGGGGDQSEQRMLATFLFQQGKLKDYIQSSVVGDYRGFHTILESTFREQISELEPKFSNYVRAVYADRLRLRTIPNSEYFPTKGEYDAFYRKNATAFKPIVAK